MGKIRIGIAGYGNLGKGVEMAIRQNDDMELAGVFTRRAPESVKLATPGVKAYRLEDAKDMKDQIDVMIICGGSATDLPKQTPELAKYFDVIDSFDTHANIPQHFQAVDEACRANGNAALISVGWDPGLFSLNRIYAESILPNGKTYTFWGKGVSQGHSDAIRRIPGVKRGIQYTVPVEDAMEQVRSGKQPELTTRQKHTRECFVVAREGADLARIEEEIKTMPNYFADYDTTVQMEGFDEIINGSLEEKLDDIVTALDRCGLEDEVAVINEAKALSANDSERYDEEYDALTKKIALHNDYEGFWDAVRKYIDSNLSY